MRKQTAAAAASSLVWASTAARALRNEAFLWSVIEAEDFNLGCLHVQIAASLHVRPDHANPGAPDAPATALLNLADLIDHWPGSRPANVTAVANDLADDADVALDEAHTSTTRMAIVFSEASGVEESANKLLLAYRNWREALLIELVAVKANTDAPRLLRKEATAAEKTFKQRTACAVQ